MADKTDIQKKVQLAAENIVGEKKGSFENRQKDSFMELGFDSLDYIELVMDVEDVFDMAITDEEAEGCKNLSEVADLVIKKLGE